MRGRLWSFGDSFVTGHNKEWFNFYSNKLGYDSVDMNITEADSFSKQWAFSSHLSKYLEMEDKNCGNSGSSNEDIIGQVEEHIDSFSRKDFILISFSTPWRPRLDNWYRGLKLDGSENKSDIDVMNGYQIHIDKVSDYLKGRNFLMTQAFCPLFGYFDTSLLPKKNKNFIEWGKRNNTLIDICAGSWLHEKKKNFMLLDTRYKSHFSKIPQEALSKDRKKYISNCNHPTKTGHKLIAKTLIPYVETTIKIGDD